MASTESTRKLTAILSADVAGYSRLMGADEEATVATLTAYREVFVSEIENHRGRVVDAKGDAILAEFASVVDVVNSAVEIQRELAERNAELPDDRRMDFRIGVNLGDVLVQADVIYGDAVNIAARLESLAQPGCIAISNGVRNLVKNSVDATFEALGEVELKNIPDPVRVWEWRCAKALPRRLQDAKLTLPKKPSVVLLPFRNLSGDEQNDFLAEGLRADIQTAVIQLSDVFLIAMGSANALRGSEPHDACTGVGVQYALHGSIRSAGNKVRISAELYDALNGRPIWAERYDHAINDSFELQDEITRKILTAMNVKLVSGEQARVWDKTLKNPKALARFYKGVHAFFQMDKDEMTRARSFFESVAEAHPEVSIGPTWVALSHWFDIQRGWAQSMDESRSQALMWAEKAAGMKDNDGQADTVLSHVHLLNLDFTKALNAGRRSITNRPACANANAFFANVLHFCGEQADAIHHINLAMRFQPLYPPFFVNILASAYCAYGKMDAAVTAAQQAIEIAPKDILARLTLIRAYVNLQIDDLTSSVVAEVMQLDPSFSVARFADTQYYRDGDYLAQLTDDLRAGGLPE